MVSRFEAGALTFPHSLVLLRIPRDVSHAMYRRHHPSDPLTRFRVDMIALCSFTEAVTGTLSAWFASDDNLPGASLKRLPRIAAVDVLDVES